MNWPCGDKLVSRPVSVSFRPSADIPATVDDAVMKPREPRTNEIGTVQVREGGIVFAIVRRPDGLICYYEDMLCHDEEHDAWWWSQPDETSGGLFGSLEEAERAIRADHQRRFA